MTELNYFCQFRFEGHIESDTSGDRPLPGIHTSEGQRAGVSGSRRTPWIHLIYGVEGTKPRYRSPWLLQNEEAHCSRSTRNFSSNCRCADPRTSKGTRLRRFQQFSLALTQCAPFAHRTLTSLVHRAPSLMSLMYPVCPQTST